ncbi:c-type cytochrome [Rhizobium halophilum]|uniref:c-type cytochrome n=1 Tax=Rhizobium halophilum TaxID=2846852 RepID=UPI001EFE27ED|nr:c-type cytochrome [Rhizobium halophilum]MCF6370676.1 c-type cytochrome [Rhizobium halophilum]
MRIRIVLTWKRLAALAGLGLAGALFVGWTGLVSIAASSGHFSVVRWFLGWTMENAVQTQSTLVSKPEDLDLDDPSLIRRSAGHYATGCAPCHGAPGVPQSPVVEEMVPSPPRLEEKVAEWSDEELFWIVKNGIKFSGMPAWPAQERDDEVWAQVAFLRALPEMARAEYADLALGGGLVDDDLEAGGETTAALDGIVKNALNDCARCHGLDGLGRGTGQTQDVFPIIAGQPAPYLYATLQAFSHGERQSGFMEPPARRYDAQVLEALARHYSEQPKLGEAETRSSLPEGAVATAREAPVADPASDRATAGGVTSTPSWQDEAGILEGEGDLSYAAVPMAASAGPPSTREELLELGRRIAFEGIGPRKIPACQSCHAIEPEGGNPFYPYLAGQPEWYLSKHLQLWQEGQRGGTAYAHVMDEIARNMTDEQIAAVAAWYSQLPTSLSLQQDGLRQ